MKGDFTRDTFNPKNHYLRVLMQQGRVQIDADQREENAILLHFLQNLAMDLIGKHGGPNENCGFEIKVLPPNQNSTCRLSITSGHYYVDGILCEMDSPTRVLLKKTEINRYSKQNNPRNTNDEAYLILCEPEINIKKTRFPQLAYLDVWERHITFIEDSNIREVALGGLDTSSRSKIIWQVKLSNLVNDEEDYEYIIKYKEIPTSVMCLIQPRNKGYLMACASQPSSITNHISNLGGNYSGLENHLYRVEIHQGGSLGATFKWSRENGSVAFPIRSMEGDCVKLDNFSKDYRLFLSEGDWIEIEDDLYVMQNKSETLRKIQKIDDSNMEVTLVPLNKNLTSNTGKDPTKHPLLRRWDHKEGDPSTGGCLLDKEKTAVVIRENEWLNLEDGVRINFVKSNATYTTGDYWLIPARVATGNIEWPTKNGKPEQKPPNGVYHHYAPLALINRSVSEKRDLTCIDCRRKFTKIAK